VCLGIAHSKIRNIMEFREKMFVKSHPSVSSLSLNILQRISKRFLSLLVWNEITSAFLFCEMQQNSDHFYLPQNASEHNYELRNSEHSYLLRNGLKQNYEVLNVFLFYEMVRNRIPSFYIFRGMARNGIF
jgi:hypothetical protein